MKNNPDKAIRANLVAIAKKYARLTGLALATVGGKFHGKQRFFLDLEAGDCGLTTAKLAEMLKAFAREWPEGKAWPRMRPILMDPPERGKKSMENSDAR